MNLLRQLEMKIESLLDDAVARVFRGALHPLEMATRILRKADINATTGEFGPIVPNRFIVTLSTEELPAQVSVLELVAKLEALVDESAMERGWRMNGPVIIEFEPGEINVGTMRCRASFQEGPRPVWASLRGHTGLLALRVNHSVVGRDPGCDVTIGLDSTSRRHAVIWRHEDRVSIRDLGSSNGTIVDGHRIGDRAVDLDTASVVVLGEAAYRFEWNRHA